MPHPELRLNSPDSPAVGADIPVCHWQQECLSHGAGHQEIPPSHVRLGKPEYLPQVSRDGLFYVDCAKKLEKNEKRLKFRGNPDDQSPICRIYLWRCARFWHARELFLAPPRPSTPPITEFDMAVSIAKYHIWLEVTAT